MKKSPEIAVLNELRDYIGATGGVPQFARKCRRSVDLVYRWLRRNKRIQPDDAATIERVTGGKFKKEHLVFISPITTRVRRGTNGSQHAVLPEL